MKLTFIEILLIIVCCIVVGLFVGNWATQTGIQHGFYQKSGYYYNTSIPNFNLDNNEDFYTGIVNSSNKGYCIVYFDKTCKFTPVICNSDINNSIKEEGE